MVVDGRLLHDQVNRYLCKSSSWYLHSLQLILVYLHLLPSAQGTAAYMALYVFYHFGPVVVSLDQGISFLNSKMTKVVMHLLKDGIYQGFKNNHGFILLAIFPIYVVQQPCVIIPIRVPLTKPTPRIFQHFGNPDAMLIGLL